MASQPRPVIKLASPGRRAARADLDNALLGASLVFAGAAVWDSAVAARVQLPGRPLGITVPLSVPPASWPAGGGRGRTVARCCLRDDRRRVHRGNLDRAGHPPARIVVAGYALAIGFNMAASAGPIAAGVRHCATARARDAGGPAATAG